MLTNIQIKQIHEGKPVGGQSLNGNAKAYPRLM